MTRCIGICADDFGLARGINEGILRLIDQQRLSAVSCLTQAAYFAEDAAQLACSNTDIGLHLNFTEPLAGTDIRQPVASLILQAYLRRLPMLRVRAQIDHQLDLFEKGCGRAPDFIDGHEHVHQLPLIREALLAALVQRYPKRSIWLRSTRPGKLTRGLPLMQRVKAHLIGALGANALRTQAQQQGFRMNADFMGVYDFARPHPHYLTMLDDWLSQAVTGTLLMSHPATRVEGADRYGLDRVTEYQVLGSEAFSALLSKLDLKISRLSTLNLAA